MLDARNFVDAVIRVRNGEVGLEDAMEAYGDEVVRRGAAETKLSREQGHHGSRLGAGDGGA